MLEIRSQWYPFDCFPHEDMRLRETMWLAQITKWVAELRLDPGPLDSILWFFAFQQTGSSVPPAIFSAFFCEWPSASYMIFLCQNLLVFQEEFRGLLPTIVRTISNRYKALCNTQYCTDTTWHNQVYFTVINLPNKGEISRAIPKGLQKRPFPLYLKRVSHSQKQESNSTHEFITRCIVDNYCFSCLIIVL